MAGELTRGASTITMQTVKNLYLWHRPLGTVRKVLELPLAFYFDAVLSKKRIIEIYLNIAEWGPNIYGIEAAAQHHFGKPAKSLTRQAGGAAGRDAAQPDRSRSGQSGAWPETTGLDHPETRGERRQPCRAACDSAAASQKYRPRRWPNAGRACIGTPTFRPWSGVQSP